MRMRRLRLADETHKIFEQDARRAGLSLDALADIRLSEGRVAPLLPAPYSYVAQSLAPFAAVSARAVRVLDALIAGERDAKLEQTLREVTGGCHEIYGALTSIVRAELAQQKGVLADWGSSNPAPRRRRPRRGLRARTDGG